MSAWLIRWTSLWKIALFFLITLACVGVFNGVIAPRFADATDGYPPIDLQMTVTPEIIYEQLPSYTERSRTLYSWFVLVDFIFPPAGSIFTVLLWAWLFRRTPNRVYDRLLSIGLFYFPFVPAVLDWLENIGFLTVVYRYPTVLQQLAELSTVARTLKVYTMLLMWALTLVFIVSSLILSIRRWRAGGSSPAG